MFGLEKLVAWVANGCSDLLQVTCLICRRLQACAGQKIKMATNCTLRTSNLYHLQLANSEMWCHWQKNPVVTHRDWLWPQKGLYSLRTGFPEHSDSFAPQSLLAQCAIWVHHKACSQDRVKRPLSLGGSGGMFSKTFLQSSCQVSFIASSSCCLLSDSLYNN